MKTKLKIVSGVVLSLTFVESNAQCLGAGESASVGATRAFFGSGSLRDTTPTNPYNGGSPFSGRYRYSSAYFSSETWNTDDHGIGPNLDWNTSFIFSGTGGLQTISVTGQSGYDSRSWTWGDETSGNLFGLRIATSNSNDPILSFFSDDGSGVTSQNVATFNNEQASSFTFDVGPSSTTNGFDVTVSGLQGEIPAQTNAAFTSTYTHVDAAIANTSDFYHRASTLGQAAWYVDGTTGERVNHGTLGSTSFADPGNPGSTTTSYGACPVPEPSSALLVALGVFGSLMRRKR